MCPPVDLVLRRLNMLTLEACAAASFVTASGGFAGVRTLIVWALPRTGTESTNASSVLSRVSNSRIVSVMNRSCSVPLVIPHQLFVADSTRERISRPEDLVYVDELPVRGRRSAVAVWSLAPKEAAPVAG